MFSLQLFRLASYGGHDGDLHIPKRCNSSLMTRLDRILTPFRGKGFLQSTWCNQGREQLCFPTQVASKVQLSACCCSASGLVPSKEMVVVLMKFASGASARVVTALQDNKPLVQCAPAVGLMIFAMWGLGPLLRTVRKSLLQKEDRFWKESQTHYLMTSYLRPLLLWIGVVMVCRAFDPVVLSTEASQAIKQRFLNFVRSLSTVLAFAYCTASLTQQLQKLMLNQQDGQNARSVGAQFIGNTVYTAVWIAAVCLFMELLGFSTQRWLTAGGLGTVLLTLAGREIFTNFLSSIMIHATRPFVINEWIQTKIEGYEVSGTVEHVGWWSPTIIRGDDREAVHIPNHKFTVSVVRNLTQKSHWRIKTHFGISHLDVSKIPSIVADMRKVLAKHPNVEQRRLHRRVFLENIDPENQSLKVLISCFVKTSHFEEYLRVKEIILLDLLKVVSHHHARLATPIRSVQRVYDEAESRSAPFRDVNRSAESHGKPYLLIDTSAVASGQHEMEQPANSAVVTNDVSDGELGASGKEVALDSSPDSKGQLKHGKEQIVAEGRTRGAGLSTEAVSAQSKPQLEGLDSMGLNSKDITLLGAAFEKPPAKFPDGSVTSAPQGEKAASKSIADGTSRRLEKRSEKNSNKVVDQHSQPGGRTEKSLSKATEQSSVDGSQGEKAASKSIADGTSVRLEKRSNKVVDQHSQPGGRTEKSSSKVTEQSSVDGLQGEKAASKSIADGTSVRLEKRSETNSNKVLDQHSQPGGKTEKSLSKVTEQSFQSAGTKLEQLSGTAASDSDYVIAREEKSVAEDLGDTKQQTHRRSGMDLRSDTRRPQGHGSSSSGPSSPKQDTDRILGSPSTTKSQSEDNLVLGVALHGPKRTLLLDNEVALSKQQKEYVRSRNGNNSSIAKERQDGSQSSTVVPPDARDR